MTPLTNSSSPILRHRRDSTKTTNRMAEVQPGDRWLILVAHPDDETFGCGSVIARASALGAEVTVVCATRGEAGEPTAEVREADLGAVREKELHRAAAILGASHVQLLEYRDSGFDGEPAGGSLCAAPYDVVVRSLALIIEEARPHVLVVLDGSDGHRDHVRIRDCVRNALREKRCNEKKSPELYEHCLPNALMRRWLDEMRSTRPDTVYLTIDPNCIGRPDHEITEVIDVSDHLAIREAAIAEHRSQTSPFDGLSDELRRAFLTVDSLARVELG